MVQKIYLKGNTMKDLRKHYTQGELIEEDVPKCPFKLFTVWFEDAVSCPEIVEPNAMVLTTVNTMSAPDARIVLLKDIRDDEFVFYTNYLSHKGQQLEQNPRCTALLPWINLERQVIIRGTASRVPESESVVYFNSRPRSSKIGAWASTQSSSIASRQELERQLQEFEKKFSDVEPSKPPHWGGVAIAPLEVEFWQGRPNRMHDRLVFKKSTDGWIVTRLQP